MAKFSDTLLSPEPFAGLMMGNHALVRGMLEAGVRVVTAYPGSPTPEIAEAIWSHARKSAARCTSSGAPTRRSRWRSRSAPASTAT